MSTPWTGPRAPYADPVEEAARTEAYWVWLDEQPAQIGDAANFADADYRGGRWRQITTSDEADYEARAMRHSIGHSWDKYSGFGDIYSFRNADDVPQMTILVADGVVVHAREHRNARLSKQNRETLMIRAEDMGWDVKPDRFRFEVMTDEDAKANNTRVVFVQRGESNAKTFFTIVVRGRFTADQAQAAHDEFGRNSHAPAMVHLGDLPRGVFGDQKPLSLVPLEIVSIRHVKDPATSAHDISKVVGGILTRDRNIQINDLMSAEVPFINDNPLMPFMTAHPVCGAKPPVCAKVEGNRLVVSYVIRDADSPNEAFWENSSGNGTFINADGEQVSMDAPRDGDVALFVYESEEAGVRTFTASEKQDGNRIPYGIFYPPAFAQDAYRAQISGDASSEVARAATEALVERAHDELAPFSEFANGEIFAIVHEMWVVGEDNHIARTDVQLTRACVDYDMTWEMIGEDVENEYEGCGLPEM